MKFLILFLIILIAQISPAQSTNVNSLFNNLVPKEIIGNLEPNPWNFKEGSHVTLNKDYISKFKSETPIIVYKQEYLREPTKSEYKIIKNWSELWGTDRYMINENQLLIVYQKKIFKLIPDTINFINWFRVSKDKAINDLNYYYKIILPNINEERLKNIDCYDPKINSSRVKLSYPLLEPGIEPVDLSEFYDQKLIISKVSWDGYFSCLLTTIDGKTLIANGFREEWYSNLNIFKNGYQIITSDSIQQIKLARKHFIDTLNVIKEQRFVVNDNNEFYFRLSNLIFQKDQIFYVANKFDINDNYVSLDTIIPKENFISEYKIVNSIFKNESRESNNNANLVARKSKGNSTFVPDLNGAIKLINGRKSKSYFESILPSFEVFDEYSKSYRYDETTNQHNKLDEIISKYSFLYKDEVSITIFLGIDSKGIIKSVEYKFLSSQNYHNIEKQRLNLGFEFDPTLTKFNLKFGNSNVREYVNSSDIILFIYNNGDYKVFR